MIGRSEKTLWMLGAALALASLYELVAPRGALSLPPVAPLRSPELPASAPPFVMPAADTFAAISDAPLFVAERQKYIAPAAEEKNAPPPPPNLSLVGVIIDGGNRLAMVKTSQGTLASSLTVGAAVAGWQVSAIEPDRILLKAGNSEDEIRLDANKAPPLAAASQPKDEISSPASSTRGSAPVPQQQQNQ